MSDSVTSQVIHQDNKQYVIHLTSVSDGTGESGVVKVDKSAMSITGQSPAVAVGHMAIAGIVGFVHGFNYVQLLWDHTSDDVALTIGPGNVDLDFSEWGFINDPQSAGGTGDLILTSSGPTSGDIYDLIIDVRFFP